MSRKDNKILVAKRGLPKVYPWRQDNPLTKSDDKHVKITTSYKFNKQKMTRASNMQPLYNYFVIPSYCCSDWKGLSILNIGNFVNSLSKGQNITKKKNISQKWDNRLGERE